MNEIDFGKMCIGTKGVGEGGQRGHVPRTVKSVCVGGYWELTVKQNLHFLYQYKYYLLLFT